MARVWSSSSQIKDFLLKKVSIMSISFKIIAKQVGMGILQITENGIVIAEGICIPEAVTSFCDNNTSTISYPDTGVFILFKGSYASSLEDKYKLYIDSNRKTNREIVFQSKNAAAQFVLGSKGRANHWK